MVLEKKILIIAPAWIGDMVMAQSLFKAIKQHQSRTTIEVLAPAWSHPVVERMPEVEKAIELPFAHGQWHFLERRRFAQSLTLQHYQQAILCPNSWKSALIPYFAHIPQRTGWRGEWRYGLLNDLRLLNKGRYPLMIERFMALAFKKNITELPKPYPIPQLICQPKSVEWTLKKYHLDRSKPVIALCPGSEFGLSKRWPESYYAAVAQCQIKKGFQVWLLGSKNDQPVAESIQTLTNQGCRNLVGKTLLKEAIDLLSIVRAMVTNDSGLMHIGAALERPLVVLYGSSSSQFTPPLSKQAKILTTHLECRPCFQRTCPLGHHRCMQELKPERVLKALEQLTG